MSRQPVEPGPSAISPVRCVVYGRWKPKGGRWLAASDSKYRSAPVVCGMRCAREWLGSAPLPPAGRVAR